MMNEVNQDVTSNGYPADQSDVACHGKDQSMSQTIAGATTNSPEVVATHNNKVRSNREELIATQEDIMRFREKSLELRERAVLQKERQTQVLETSLAIHKAFSLQNITKTEDAQSLGEEISNPLKLLQQANAQLVIATLEAHKLVDEEQIARVKLLDHLAHHDILTQLPNRLLLSARLIQAIELAQRERRKLAIMYIDLDGFKHINDSLGHAVGDELLRSVAQRLRECIRHSDTLSRQGGDEFVLLLPSIEHAEDAALFAQKMLAVMTPPHYLAQNTIHISISIGISIYPHHGEDAETLLKSADTAMYHAKEAGRNNYQFFVQDMHDQAVERHFIESGLRRALEDREFELVYQPKINLQNGVIIGVEALIRWQHPSRGLLLPAQFISIAEACGLIVPIGRWVMREACRQGQVWQQMCGRPITVAINTSASEFRDKGFLDNLLKTLEDTHLDPHCLELELTESVLMREIESVTLVLQKLRTLGVKLAIDDFGTGYSSLSYLRQFPIHTLKIDQSFVSRLTTNTDDATLLAAVISMGKSLKKQVIAEGVETSDQHKFLVDHNCDEGQGYYFGYPISAEGLSALLQANSSQQ